MTITEYKEQMTRKAPCDEGLEAFEKCKSRKDVFKLLAGPVGVDFFLQSIQDGWGPTVDDFLDAFLPYVNGAMTVKFEAGNRIVRSQVWSRCRAIEVDDSVRWLILVGCSGKVKIKPFQVIQIFVDANSLVEIDGGENSIIYVRNYGGHVIDLNKVCKFK